MITKTRSTVLVGLAVLMAAPAAHAGALWGDKMEATFGADVLYGPLYAGSHDVSGSSTIERRNSVFGNVALTYTY